MQITIGFLGIVFFLVFGLMLPMLVLPFSLVAGIMAGIGKWHLLKMLFAIIPLSIFFVFYHENTFSLRFSVDTVFTAVLPALVYFIAYKLTVLLHLPNISKIASVLVIVTTLISSILFLYTTLYYISHQEVTPLHPMGSVPPIEYAYSLEEKERFAEMPQEDFTGVRITYKRRPKITHFLKEIYSVEYFQNGRKYDKKWY